VRVGLAATVLVLAAGCGGHSSSQPTTATRAQAKPQIHVRLTADTHHPRVGKPWHYEVRVTDAAGQPVPARVHLQIVFAGAPVGQIGRHRVANGVWQETIGADGNAPFPSRARGIKLAFQAIANARGQTAKANYWIVVQ
jgi:hypothetical protein